MMTTFLETYTAARQAFRERALAHHWELTAWPTEDAGPDGQPLAVDVAVTPARAGDRVLVISSGLHGVEAPLGSAVQRALVDAWSSMAGATEVRCVLIHALNPYGFAWSRRCDADNVDPNRNFWDRCPAGTGRSGIYASFDHLLNPKHPPSSLDFFRLRAVAAALRHGQDNLRRALVSGQSDFPKGLFFGGTTAGVSRTLLERHLHEWIGRAERVVHLDIHTGLGRWASGKLLVDYAMTPDVRAWITRTFPVAAIEEAMGTGRTYQAVGSLAQWCVARALAPRYFFAFAEFGTYGDIAVLAGLRQENQAHHWTPPVDRRLTRARARLRELFCPASPEWRSRVMAESEAWIVAACKALAE
jgi:hypothetical protein